MHKILEKDKSVNKKGARTYFEKTLRLRVEVGSRSSRCRSVSVLPVHSAGRCTLFCNPDRGDLYSQRRSGVGGRGNDKGCTVARACVRACVCVRANGKGRVDGHNASDGADDGDITNAPAVTKSLFDFLFF